MTVSFGTIGATSDGTTSLATDYPAGISAGNLLLYFVGSKFDTSSHSTPSGFAPLDSESAGAGNEFGSDSGTIVASLFDRIATGSEAGTESVAVTSGNVAQGFIARLTRSGGSAFDIAATTARWTTDSTNPLSVTFDDAVGFAADDYVLVFAGLNTNATTGVTSQALTAAGATFSSPTQRAFTATGTGGDMAVHLVEFTVVSGSSAAAPSFVMTKSGSTQGEGPLILVRVRESGGGGGGGFIPAWARPRSGVIGSGLR